MALFTARPRRAGTKGATPAAVQYIPHAERGLVPEPWAKSTAQHGGEAAYVGVNTGGPTGLQKPPRSFGGVASRKRSDFTALPDGVFGFSRHRSEALSDRVLLFKCPFEVGARKAMALTALACAAWASVEGIKDREGDRLVLIKLLMRSSREKHLKLQQKQAVEAGTLVRGRRRRCDGYSEIDDKWMECGGLNFFDAGLRLCSLGPYLPIRTFCTGQTVALRWAEQRNGVDLDQYPSLQRSRAAGHP
ncbi:unnamed protein product [Leuciscus chuanchicus]